MKLVLDIIPNHSSDQHPWFEKDRNKDYDGPYKDYYIWHEGRQGDDGSRKPPSNWVSIVFCLFLLPLFHILFLELLCYINSKFRFVFDSL